MSEAARQVDDAVDRTLDESGTVLGERYRLLRPLGEGGAGIVYAATDERIGAEVAIKVVRGSARRDEVTLARFHREARAAGKLGHPNIVRVTDFGTSASGSPYVVMERLDGETLEARIQREGKLDPALVTDVHIQLADALAAAHAAGVLHRDVKPANVFLTQLATGKVLVKLLDFGLAELYQEPGSPRLTERGLLVGSLAYLAPERILGEPANEQSDVYGIGASLYESLTGGLPFEAPNPMMMRARILEGSVAPIEEAPPVLAEIARLCLARDPAERLSAAAEVRRRLLVAPVTAAPKVEPQQTVAPGTVAASTSPSRAWIVAVIAVAAIVVLGVVLAQSGTPPPSSVVAAPPSVAPIVVTTVDDVVPHARIAPELAAPPSEIAPPPSVASPPPTTEAIRARPPTTRVRTEVREPEPPPSSSTTEAEAPTPEEHAPTRFDRIQEPDWGTPIPAP